MKKILFFFLTALVQYTFAAEVTFVKFSKISSSNSEQVEEGPRLATSGPITLRYDEEIKLVFMLVDRLQKDFKEDPKKICLTYDGVNDFECAKVYLRKKIFRSSEEVLMTMVTLLSFVMAEEKKGLSIDLVKANVAEICLLTLEMVSPSEFVLATYEASTPEEKDELSALRANDAKGLEDLKNRIVASTEKELDHLERDQRQPASVGSDRIAELRRRANSIKKLKWAYQL
jgi:hypothetical protein